MTKQRQHNFYKELIAVEEWASDQLRLANIDKVHKIEAGSGPAIIDKAEREAERKGAFLTWVRAQLQSHPPERGSKAALSVVRSTDHKPSNADPRI